MKDTLAVRNPVKFLFIHKLRKRFGKDHVDCELLVARDSDIVDLLREEDEAKAEGAGK